MASQLIYKFPNGYGASVIPEYVERIINEYEDFMRIRKVNLGNMQIKRFPGTVAVFWNDELCYDTEITDDVMRHLVDPDVDNVLGQIKNLME